MLLLSIILSVSAVCGTASAYHWQRGGENQTALTYSITGSGIWTVYALHWAATDYPLVGMIGLAASASAGISCFRLTYRYCG